jgi:hypothetical protein
VAGFAHVVDDCVMFHGRGSGFGKLLGELYVERNVEICGEE